MVWVCSKISDRKYIIYNQPRFETSCKYWYKRKTLLSGTKVLYFGVESKSNFKRKKSLYLILNSTSYGTREMENVSRNVRKNGKVKWLAREEKERIFNMPTLSELRYHRVKRCADILQFTEMRKVAWNYIRHARGVVIYSNEFRLSTVKKKSGRFLFWTLTTKACIYREKLNHHSKMNGFLMLDYKKTC